MSTNYGFEPTLDGLNNIDADSSTTTNIICDTITVNTSSSVPTRTAGDSTTNIANTQFVTNAVTTAGANYVDLTSTQTVTGAKTFSNANTVISGNLVTNNIVSASATTDINIGSALTTGDVSIGGGSATNVALNWGGSSNSGNLTFQGGSFTLASTGNYNQSGGATFVTNISTNQSSGIMNIGTAGARSGAININTGTTSTAPVNISSATNANAPITIGSTASTTQTCAMDAITTFSKIPSCAVVPTTANHLCNKTYVDSVAGGGVNLGDYNVWTNENDFTNIVKVQDPTLATYAGIDLFSSITPGIVINGAPGTTSALSGVNLNTNTLTVPIKNNQSLIRLRIPMDIAAFGVPSFYFGQLDIIFNSITAITILKNGSFYKTVSVFKLLNFTGTTKSWTGWAFKGENARAYVGDVQFELEITTGNTSADTYTIGITMNVAVNAAAVGLMTPRFLCTGDVNFTTTHAQSPTGVTYISTDPASFFPYQINFGNSGNYIIGKGDTYIKTTQGGVLTLDAWTDVEMKAQNGIAVLAGEAGGVGDLNLKTLGTGAVNIQSAGATNINSGANINIQTGVAGGLIDLKVSDGTTGVEIQDVTGSGQYQKAYIVIPETSRINIIPEGTILTSVVSTAPEGYVLCDGTSYSSTNVASNKYRRLFNAIGYTFGGSGASFNVPNFLGAVLKSQGSQVSGGVTYSGAALGTAQADAVQTPLAPSNQGWRGAAAGTRECISRTIIGTDPIDTNTGILTRFTRTATDNRVFTYSVYYYIKF